VAKPKKTERMRLKEWNEFLKDDADFDYEHILNVLCYKLGRTKECIVANGIVMDAEKIAKEIEEVEELLHKVIDDNYFREMTEAFRKENGDLEWETIGGKSDKFSEMRFFFPNETPKNRKGLFRQWHTYGRKAEKARIADLRKAFKIMSEKIWGWWD
jgi:hypothetical protein